jgi:hypothetical protein
MDFGAPCLVGLSQKKIVIIPVTVFTYKQKYGKQYIGLERTSFNNSKGRV